MGADLRLAGRRLLATPGATLVAVLSLALGVGATVAAFAFVQATILRPFPTVPRAERVVRVGTTVDGAGPWGSSYPAFAAYRDGVRAFDGLAAYQLYAFGVRSRGDAPAARTWGVFASGDYFRVLGVRPALGRLFGPADDRPGAPPAVVLSYPLWRERFAGDPAVVGRALTVNGRPATVVGVAPRGFAGADAIFRVDLWVPLATYPALGDYPTKLEDGHSRWLQMVGRLRDGASPGDAQAQAATVSARLVAARTIERDTRPAVRPFDLGEGGQVVPQFFAVLLAAGVTLLLVVCANVAGLLLVRGLARARDHGVRAAVGASRARLAREALAEAAVVATVGGAVGVLAGWLGTRALVALVPAADMPLGLRTPLDGRVLAAALGCSTLAALAAGLAPALRAAGADPAALLQGGRGTAQRRPRLAGVFAVAQVAFAAVAIVCAGLFARTYAELRRADVGMRAPERAAVAWTDFGYVGRRAEAAKRQPVADLLARLAATPGVAAAAVADFVPLGNRGYDTWTVNVDGYTPAARERMDVGTNRVTAGYFDAVGTPVVRGRAFTDADGPDAPPVALVSEAFARRYFGAREPVGATIRVWGAPLTVVGVARDAAYRDDDVARPARPFLYRPYAQNPVAAVGVVVRAAPGVDPLSLAPGLRRAVAAADPGLPLTAPVTLAEWSRNATLLPRLAAKVLGTLGACALALAALGVFAVVAYEAARRRREVGVRVALGATAAHVARVVVGDGARLAAVGLLLGGALALGAARLARGLLVGVAPGDPVTYLAAAAVLLAAALGASWIPARRAARVDPTEALRAE